MSADDKFLEAIQERLIYLREKKFKTPSEFGNVANVNERRNEKYLKDIRLTSLGKTLITLDVDFNASELITKEILKTYADNLSAEDVEREKRGE